MDHNDIVNAVTTPPAPPQSGDVKIDTFVTIDGVIYHYDIAVTRDQLGDLESLPALAGRLAQKIGGQAVKLGLMSPKERADVPEFDGSLFVDPGEGKTGCPECDSKCRDCHGSGNQYCSTGGSMACDRCNGSGYEPEVKA